VPTFAKPVRTSAGNLTAKNASNTQKPVANVPKPVKRWQLRKIQSQVQGIFACTCLNPKNHEKSENKEFRSYHLFSLPAH
jgi:hypothetical protein